MLYLSENHLPVPGPHPGGTAHGKTANGEMEPAEFVVTMLIANLAAIPMQDSGIPLLSGLVPILTVLGVQLILAVASMRFISFRRLLCGKPVILIREEPLIKPTCAGPASLWTTDRASAGAGGPGFGAATVRHSGNQRSDFRLSLPPI